MTETTNYRLKKPAEGSSGWANDVNNNFDVIDNKMKANEGIGDTVSEHLSGSPGRHTSDQIASQIAEALVNGSLENLLLAIVGTSNPSEFTKNLNHLKDHLDGNSTKHESSSISIDLRTFGFTSYASVYTALYKIFNKMPYMYNFRYVAEASSVDISESVLKTYTGFLEGLEGSVSTDLSIQILKDEGDFYTQENTITTKIYKQIENYAGITKEHLDKINIGGLTVGDTYKIIVWFKRTDASGPEDPL